MKRNPILRSTLLFIAAGLAASAFLVPPTQARATALHFGLSKSVPAADSTVAAPESVQLWFTEVPQDGSVSIRVIDAAGGAIHTSDVAQSTDEPASFSVELHHALADGTYTVAWRGMGSDGHVVRDDFLFTVTSQQ